MKQYYATNNRPPFGFKESRSYAQKATQKVLVYDALRAAGENGLNRREISDKTGVPVDRVTFYLSELRRGGFIAIKGAPVEVSQLSPEDALFYALDVLEQALVAKAKTTITDDMRRSFLKYQKMKAVALHKPTAGQVGATPNEIRQGLKLAMLELIKAVL